MDVKLSNDGKRILIGASNDGAVYIYDFIDNGWQLNFTKYWNLGQSINNGFLRADLSHDGKYFAVSNFSHDGGSFEGPKTSGGKNYGLVLIYQEADGLWSDANFSNIVGGEFELLGSELKFAVYSNKLFITSHNYGAEYSDDLLLAGSGKLSLYNIDSDGVSLAFEKIGEARSALGQIAGLIEFQDGTIKIFGASGEPTTTEGDSSEYSKFTDEILVGNYKTSSEQQDFTAIPYHRIGDLDTSCINAAFTSNKLFAVMKTTDGSHIELVSWKLDELDQPASIELDLSYTGSTGFTQVDFSGSACEYKMHGTQYKLYLSLINQTNQEKFLVINSKVDMDGDGILDFEDPDPSDGPLADKDGDGILNKDDEVYSYEVFINPGLNGYASGDGIYDPGEQVNFSYEAEKGYQFSAISSDDVEIVDNSFVMPSHNVLINISFTEKDETQFGQAIYVTPDEKYMALTIEGETQGEVEVYELNKDGSIKSPVGSRIVPNNTNYTETLSTGVGLVDVKLSNSGERLLIAAHNYAIIYIYDLKYGEWELNYTNLWPSAVSNSSGGLASMRADLSHDGKFFAIGLPSYDRGKGLNSGAVLIYKETEAGWHYGSDFIPLINGDDGDVLGANVKFSTYSNKLLVSRQQWGTAYNNAWGKLYLYDISTEGKTILLDQTGTASNSGFGILANIKELSDGGIKIFAAETETTGIDVVRDGNFTTALLIATYIDQDTPVSFEEIPYYSINELDTSCISSAFTESKFFAVMKTTDGSKTHLVSWLLSNLQAEPVLEKDLSHEDSQAFSKVNWDGPSDYPICATDSSLYISFINKTKDYRYISMTLPL